MGDQIIPQKLTDDLGQVVELGIDSIGVHCKNGVEYFVDLIEIVFGFLRRFDFGRSPIHLLLIIDYFIEDDRKIKILFTNICTSEQKDKSRVSFIIEDIYLNNDLCYPSS